MRIRLFCGGLLVIASIVGTANVAVGGGGCHQPANGQPQDTRLIEMKNLCILPGVARIHRGDTVEVVNRDSLTHNVEGIDWFYGDLPPGASTQRTFNEVGTFTFACTLHPGMTAAIIVEDAQPIAAAVPAARTGVPPDSSGGGGSGGGQIVLVLGIVGGLLVCLGGGWTLGRVMRPRLA